MILRKMCLCLSVWGPWRLLWEICWWIVKIIRLFWSQIWSKFSLSCFRRIKIESYLEIWLIFLVVWLEWDWTARNYSWLYSNFYRDRVTRTCRRVLICFELWSSRRSRLVRRWLRTRYNTLLGYWFTHRLSWENLSCRYLLIWVTNPKR